MNQILILNKEQFKQAYDKGKDFIIQLNSEDDSIEHIPNDEMKKLLNGEGHYNIPKLIRTGQLFIFDNVKYKTVYHASNHDFDFPNYEHIVSNRTNHKNGELGLWCAFSHQWIKGFGENIYELTYKNENIKQISFHDFYKKCNMKNAPDEKEEEDFYLLWREELMKEGFDVLEIVESSGSIDMLIVLNFDAIKSFKKINKKTA